MWLSLRNFPELVIAGCQRGNPCRLGTIEFYALTNVGPVFAFTNSKVPGFDGSLRSPLAMTIVWCALETPRLVIAGRQRGNPRRLGTIEFYALTNVGLVFAFTNSTLPGFDGSLRSPLAMTIVWCATESTNSSLRAKRGNP